MASFRLSDYELKRIANEVLQGLEPMVAELLASQFAEPIKEEQNEWLTIQDAASRFGVGYWVIREAVKTGELLAYKPGRFYRIRPSDLEQWATDRAKRQMPELPSGENI